MTEEKNKLNKEDIKDVNGGTDIKEGGTCNIIGLWQDKVRDDATYGREVDIDKNKDEYVNPWK